MSDRAVYRIKVKLGHEGISRENGTISVGVMSARQKGRANLEMIKNLAAYFDVPQQNVRIVDCLKSRNDIY